MKAFKSQPLACVAAVSANMSCSHRSTRLLTLRLVTFKNLGGICAPIDKAL